MSFTLELALSLKGPLAGPRKAFWGEKAQDLGGNFVVFIEIMGGNYTQNLHHTFWSCYAEEKNLEEYFDYF